MKRFDVFIGLLPPSSNKIHTTGRGRKRLVLSQAARNFKTDFYEALKEFAPPSFGPDEELVLDVTFYLEKFKTEGWKTGKAKRKYRRRDVSNMLKLLEDVVALYLEIDDSQFLDIVARKRQAKQSEGVRVCVKRLKKSH
jgi:Holliday junction resolvase RusA-like endonuclease